MEDHGTKEGDKSVGWAKWNIKKIGLSQKKKTFKLC